MPSINHQVILDMVLMRHNFPCINWDTLVITLAQNVVGSQPYPAEMQRLLQYTVFVQLNEVKGYDYQGVQVNLSQ